MARLTDFEPHWINMPQAATGVRFYIGVSFLNPMGEREEFIFGATALKPRVAVEGVARDTTSRKLS